MKLLASILAALALTGCATAEYQAYADIHKEQAKAQAARYAALAEIAKQGDTTAKVAAVITLNQGAAQSQPQIAPPKTLGDHLFQWTGALLPSLTQIYGINKQAQVGITQSNNAAALGMSTNAAFVGIAGKIQAPGATTTTTTTTTTTDNSVRTDNTSTPTVVTQPAPVVVPTTTTTTNLTCTTGPC